MITLSSILYFLRVQKPPLNKPGLAGPSNVIRDKVWGGGFLFIYPN